MRFFLLFGLGIFAVLDFSSKFFIFLSKLKILLKIFVCLVLPVLVILILTLIGSYRPAAYWLGVWLHICKIFGEDSVVVEDGFLLKPGIKVDIIDAHKAGVLNLLKVDEG